MSSDAHGFWGYIAFTGFLLLAILLSVFLIYWLSLPAEEPFPNFDSFKEQVQPTVDSIYTYRELNGVYPDSLSQIGPSEIETIAGALKYEKYRDPVTRETEFCVSAGNYDEDEFEFAYCSTSQWIFDA